ncbi:MAG: SDR family oxidoreductase [Phycisphaerales bacterium]|nr:SDR family oxidoreductase [Planctomycetota bacterium]MCH8507908.1 SDR family oxidoreductase [Phycisphaerales bacterium]
MSEAKVAIVTGAGSGVGRCVAKHLAEAGYRVALVGRTESRLRETGELLGPEGMCWKAIPADITSDADRARIVEETQAAFGRIDALVNNAGAAGLKKLKDFTIEDLREQFEVNALGPIDLAARCLRVMDPQGGVVVFTSSMSTKDPFPGLGVYGCAKSALNAACRAIMNEKGKSDFRAYAVAPGAIETGMLRSMWNEKILPKDKTLDPDQVAEAIVACVTGETDAKPGETIYMPSH